MNQKEWDRMIGQELYDPFNVHDDSFQRVHAAQRKFNASDDLNDRQAFEEMKRCFAQAPDDMVLLAPVYFDHGDRIRFGRHFFANTGLTILDENYVTFGDNVFLAPHVSIYTAGRRVIPLMRKSAIPTWNTPNRSLLGLMSGLAATSSSIPVSLLVMTSSSVPVPS